MNYLRSLPSILGAGSLAVLTALPSAAQAGGVTVDVYRPAPIYVVPAPRVVVVTDPHHCVVRTTRVWVGDHYAYRRVKRCH